MTHIVFIQMNRTSDICWCRCSVYWLLSNNFKTMLDTQNKLNMLMRYDHTNIYILGKHLNLSIYRHVPYNRTLYAFDAFNHFMFDGDENKQGSFGNFLKRKCRKKWSFLVIFYLNHDQKAQILTDILFSIIIYQTFFCNDQDVTFKCSTLLISTFILNHSNFEAYNQFRSYLLSMMENRSFSNAKWPIKNENWKHNNQ